MAQGEIRYRLVAENKDFRDAFKQAQEHVLSLGTGITELNQALELIEKGFGAVKGAMSAAIVPLEKALDVADKLSNLSAKTGVSAEALQKLGAVGLTTGTSMESLGGAIVKMQKGLVETPGNFDRMGLSAQKLIAMKPEEAFAQIAQKIGSIESPAQRTAAAIAAFGKSGADMLPLFATNISEVSERAQRLGLVLSNDTVAALDAVGDQLDLTKAAGGAVITNFGAMIGTAPGVGAAVRAIGDMFGVLSAAIFKNKDGIQGVTSALADGLVNAIRGSGAALVAMADVAQTGLDVWSSLRLTWIASKTLLYDLGIAFNYAAKAADILMTVGGSKLQDTFSENIALLKAAKGAAEGEAAAVVKSNTDKSNSLAVFRTAMQGVSAELQKVGQATEAGANATKQAAGSYKGAADAAAVLKEELAEAAAEHKQWLAAWKDHDAIVKKAVADDVAQFKAEAAMFQIIQNQMTLANTSGVGRRLAEAKIAHDQQMRDIAALGIKDKTELAAMTDAANRNYAQMKAAAMGYFKSAELAGASLGISTRQELADTANAAKAAYQQMKESGLFTEDALREAKQKAEEAKRKMDGDSLKAYILSFENLTATASGMLRNIFGKSKAAAIAAAVIDTIAAVVKTMAHYPWPFSLIPAAAAAAAGYAQVQAIRGQEPGFRQGTPSLGFVDFGAGTQTVLHGREAVVPEGRARDFAAMHGGGGGGDVTFVIPISIGGEKLDDILVKRQRAGFLRR